MKSNDPNSITDRLHHLVAREMELVHDRFRNLGLNNQQARLLKYVSEHPGTDSKRCRAVLKPSECHCNEYVESVGKTRVCQSTDSG